MTERKFGSTLQTLDRLRKNGNLAALSRNPRTAEDTQPAFMRLAAIAPDPDQPRRHFDPDQLASLAESIKEQGVLQAITIQPPNAEGMHLIIMGERRYRAAKLAGVDAIPVVIRPMTDELRMAQLTENVQRADLTTLEIGEAVAAMRAAGRSRAEIGKALGWSESAVSRFAAIAQMPEPLRQVAAAGAPVRAVANLHALWKKDEAAVSTFLAQTKASEITEPTVEKLRAAIEMPAAAVGMDVEPLTSAEPEAAPDQTVGLTEAATAKAAAPGLGHLLEDVGQASSETADVSSPLEASSPAPRLQPATPTLIVRHGERDGQAMLAELTDSPSKMMVQFDVGGALEVVDLAELVMVELRRT